MLNPIAAFPFQIVVCVTVLVPELHGDFVGEGCGEEFFAEAVGSWGWVRFVSLALVFGLGEGDWDDRGCSWVGHVLLTLPFLGQEGFDLVMAAQESAAVAPDGCGGVGKGYTSWVSVVNMLVSISCLEGVMSRRRKLMQDESFVLGIP